MRPLACATLLSLAALAACDRGPPAPAPRRPGGPAQPAPPAQSPQSPRAVAAPSLPDAALSSLVAEALASALRRAGLTATTQGARVTAGRRAVLAEASVINTVNQGDHVAAELDVVLVLDGRAVDAFHTRGVGFESSRDEAARHAVREWAVAYANPIADALRAASEDDPASTLASRADAGAVAVAGFPVGPYRAFPGPTGIRGEAPPGWNGGTPGFHRALLARIEPAFAELLPASATARFRSLKVTLLVRDGVVAEGDCRADGEPAARLCDLLRAHPWPRGSEYMVKQYYVLVAPRPR